MTNGLARALFLAWVGVIILIVVPWGELHNPATLTRAVWVPFREFDIGDVVHNLLLYAPFGFFYRTFSTRASIGRLAAHAFALSAATELTQLLSMSRFPSATDVTCNVLGAWYGATWATHRATLDDRKPRVAFESRHGRHERYLGLLVVAAGLLTAAETCAVSVREGGPDAFVVFRYVARWLGGGGLTFNDGEHVEGFTSIAWALLLAGFTRITGVEVPVGAALLNTAILLALVVLLDRTLRVAHAPPSVRAIAVMAFATSYLYFRVCFLGLEFALFGLLLTIFYALVFFVFQMTRDARHGGLLFSALGATGGLLFATRPEALVILPLTMLSLRLGAMSYRHHLMQGTAVYAAIAGVVVVWRRIQFGEWLPNTVVAKSILLGDPFLAHTVAQRVIDGGRYLSDAYGAFPLIAVIMLTAIHLAAVRALHARSILLLIPIIWAHLIVLENGGDWLFGFSLVLMYLPVYLLLGFSVGVDTYNRYGRHATITLIMVGLALHAWVNAAARRADEHSGTPLDGDIRQRFTTLRPDSALSPLYAEVGRALNTVWVRGDILVAESVGPVAYAAPDVYVHDPSGLTDRMLAHDPEASQSVFGRMNWRYTLSLKPAVLLLHFWPHQQSWSTVDARYPEDFDRYCLRAAMATRPPFILYVIIRKGRSQYSDAIRHLGALPLQNGADLNLRCSR